MNPESEILNEVLKKFIQGLQKAKWGVTVLEKDSQEPRDVVEVSENSVIVAEEDRTKTIPFTSIGIVTFKNPNPKT